VYRRLAARLQDARRLAPQRGLVATFPSTMPMLRIDHVFVGPGVRVRRIHVPADPLTRMASDHLPLVIDFELETVDATLSERTRL
jgi:endonuclease/exonuclease/phosphatase family metal-dependent hydrolase